MLSPTKVTEKLSKELKKYNDINMPDWAKLVKTGSNVERVPTQPDWWYLRAAAVLRNIYTNGPVGTQRLRTVFGSRKRRGTKPSHQVKAGGKIIRTMLQQLEKSNLIKKVERPRKGRVVTPKGQKIVDKARGA